MLSADETRRLDLVTFGASRTSPSARAAGNRVARARGFGSEFYDFRHYQPGDDLRTIEWTVLARLGQLVTRTYRAEGQLRVHLLVDTSASMRLGSPGKLACAHKLATVLAYVALRGGDAVGVAAFDERLRHPVRPAAGRSQLHRVIAALATTPSSGRSAIGRALMQYGALERGPGLVVVLSDCFDPAGMIPGLRYLLHQALTPAVLQVLAPEEIDPSVAEEIELTDVEDPEAPPLVVDAGAIAAYRSALGTATAALGEFCATHGLPCARINAGGTFTSWLDDCRRAGLLAE